MNRFEVAPFGKLVAVHPTRFTFDGRGWNPPMDELVRRDDERQHQARLSQYMGRPRARLSIINEHTLRIEKYDGRELITAVVDAPYTTIQGQTVEILTPKGIRSPRGIRVNLQTSKLQFRPEEWGYNPDQFVFPFLSKLRPYYARNYPAPIMFYVREDGLLGPESVKQFGAFEPLDAPAPNITKTKWESNWVTIQLLRINGQRQMVIKSDMFPESSRKCTSFETPSGERVEMVDADGKPLSERWETIATEKQKAEAIIKFLSTKRIESEHASSNMDQVVQGVKRHEQWAIQELVDRSQIVDAMKIRDKCALQSQKVQGEAASAISIDGQIHPVKGA